RANRSGGHTLAGDGRTAGTLPRALARRDGDPRAGAGSAAGIRGHASRPARSLGRIARLPGRSAPAAFPGDEIPEMTAQAPDIGKMIFHHTADSRVVEGPFGWEWHLPTGWSLFG